MEAEQSSSRPICEFVLAKEGGLDRIGLVFPKQSLPLVFVFLLHFLCI